MAFKYKPSKAGRYGSMCFSENPYNLVKTYNLSEIVVPLQQNSKTNELFNSKNCYKDYEQDCKHC